MNRCLIALAAVLVSACATTSVSKAYAVDVCAERDNYTDCINRLAAAQCPNGANDLDAHRDANGRLHVDVGCD